MLYRTVADHRAPLWGLGRLAGVRLPTLLSREAVLAPFGIVESPRGAGGGGGFGGIMAYSAQADIEARISASVIIALTDDEQLATTATDVDAAIVLNSAITARLDACIGDADSEIDSYIRKQYSVPLSTTPARVLRISVDLAVYFLHGRRVSEMGVPDDVRDSWKAAMAWLKDVNRGHIDLGVEPPPAASSVVVSEADGEDRAFTKDTLKEF